MSKNKLVLTNRGFVHGDSNGKIYFSWKINKRQIYQILPRGLRGFLERHPEVVEIGYDLVELDHYLNSEIIAEE